MTKRNTRLARARRFFATVFALTTFVQAPISTAATKPPQAAAEAAPQTVAAPPEKPVSQAALLLGFGVAALALFGHLLSKLKAARAQHERSELMLKAVLDASNDLIFLQSPAGELMASNHACARLLGDAPGTGAALPEALSRRDGELLGGSTAVRYRQSVPLPAGGSLLLDTWKSPVRDSAGRALGLLGVAHIVASSQAMHGDPLLALKVFEHCAEGIVITDPDGVVEAVNPAFSRITGYSAGEIIGERPSKLSSGRQDKAFYQNMWSTLLNTGQWQGEVWNCRKSGEVYAEWLNISAVNDDQGKLAHYLGIFSDITLIKSHEARLQHMAHHDALTDLPNRALLSDRLDLAIRHAARGQHMLGLVFMDLDHFKDINDNHGHDVGDEVLREVARRIASALRDGDTVARLGGDEFVALLDNVDSTEAADQAAQRILASLAEPVRVDGHAFAVGASIGIGLYPRDGSSAKDLLRAADIAMYQAKRRGRNTVRSYASVTAAAARSHHDIERLLRDALTQDRIRVAYQAQVDVVTRQLVGIEALARWYDPALGDVAPAEFIPVAERSGQILALGEAVLRQACAQARAWREAGLEPPRLAVNVSERQLRRPDFVARTRDILDATSCKPQWLTFEVTEAGLNESTDACLASLNALRELGIALSLDDFGTSHSSLSLLRRLPLDSIKIDQKLVRELPGNAEQRITVDAIVAVGKALQVDVLAEGIETDEQALCLNDIGCVRGQGYLFSRPTAAGELSARIASA